MYFEWLVSRQQSRPDAELKTVLGELFPKRLAQRLCELALGNQPLRQYRAPELQAIAERLQRWEFHPSGTEGYRTAEVTLGGVNTDELSSATMASKKVARPLFHRRGGRCDRPSRRIQFPMGLGLWSCGWAGGLSWS